MLQKLYNKQDQSIYAPRVDNIDNFEKNGNYSAIKEKRNFSILKKIYKKKYSYFLTVVSGNILLQNPLIFKIKNTIFRPDYYDI